jgi:hypothetical protein
MKISQEYFDQIVNENLNDFGMSEEEAIEDAVNQLKSQGADLNLICKYSQAERQSLHDALKKVSELAPKLVLNTAPETELIEHTLEALNLIKLKFDKDISFRCFATKIEPQNALTTFLEYFKLLVQLDTNTELNYKVIEVFLNTFQAYITQQNDILGWDGQKALLKLTDKNETLHSNSIVLSSILKCINAACVMNEQNRQVFVEQGLCENLMQFFSTHSANDVVIRDLCQLIRSILLDDDLRVEFGKAHEHAKYIASKLNGLDVLLQVGLGNENLEEETLANIMLTLSKLAVRNEFCQEICDKGGLIFVLKCIEEQHLKNVNLLKSALSLLKSICNNDQVKHEATKSNGIELLKIVLQKYNANPQVRNICFKVYNCVLPLGECIFSRRKILMMV